MALSKRKKAMYMRYAMYVVSIAFLIAVILFIDWERLGNAMFRWNIVKEQFPDILTKAAKNTVVFTILGFAGGLSFGLLFALMRLSSILAYRWFAATYIEIFRGIPLLVTLLILGFGIPIATGWKWPNGSCTFTWYVIYTCNDHHYYSASPSHHRSASNQ